MGQVKFDYSKTAGYVHEHEVESMKALTESARKLLLSKSGAGNDYLGWIDLPVDYDKEEFARIKKAAEKIKSDSDVLVVIGIGGSYLGARAAIEFLGHNFFNSVSKDLRKAPEIYFVGNSISSNYLTGLVDVIGDRDFSEFTGTSYSGSGAGKWDCSSFDGTFQPEGILAGSYSGQSGAWGL